MMLCELDKNIFLSQVNLAGTHDSATAFVAMEDMSRCQSLTIKQQLELGIRLFDIRLNKKGDEFFLIHGLADCYCEKEKKNKLPFSQVLSDFKDFLEQNPKELLVVSIKQDRGIMSRRFFPAFYNRYIKGEENLWYLKNENPTLSRCIGKMVLMRRCKVKRKYKNTVDAGLDFSKWEDQGGKKKTKTEGLILSDNLSAEIQDRYGLDCNRKWYNSAKPFLDRCETSKNKFAIHFVSTSFRKKGETLVETAKEMNGLFEKYELRRDRAQGWIFLDFPTKELSDKIMMSNFEIYKENTK